MVAIGKPNVYNLSQIMAEAHHPIKMVVRRTGLSAHVIRIWEKRYGAVKPERTGSNRRLYSEEQITRLSLLRDLTRAGHSIGSVARLPLSKLRALAADIQAPSPAVVNRSEIAGKIGMLDECVTAVKKLDSRALEGALRRGSIELGSQGLLQRVIAPLAETIGGLWRDGSITAAHEHFASAVIRMFLGHAATAFAGWNEAPVVVVATPTGQLHELGALLAGASAANLGWRVTYLGPSLPAAEIAGVAIQNRARAVALSVVYPEDDPQLAREFAALRKMLPIETALLVGGRAAPAYYESLEKAGALIMRDLPHLSATLDDLRRGKRFKG